MKLSLLHKFNHWSEVLSVLNYADKGSDIPFVSHKWLNDEEKYVDPLGNRHDRFLTAKYASQEGRCLVVNGSIHLETHPLSLGKIPYPKLPCKIAIEHTTGYSPWDFLQMVELAEISASHSDDAQGSKVRYLMNKKCYNRFMSTDWDSCGRSYFTEWKPRIEEMVKRGYVVPTAIEPAQFWLENVKHSDDLVHSDHLCICLNWCNLNKVVKVQKIVEICKDLHKFTGKDIDIRLHSYSRKSLFHLLEELSFVHLIPYESMSKYDVMDKYDQYFVDGTGLGYEIAYRAKFNHRNIDIFYLSGLPSDEPHEGFDGIFQMGAVPQYDYKEFINGTVDHSNFTDDVIKESFPHQSGNVPNECYEILDHLSDDIMNLD